MNINREHLKYNPQLSASRRGTINKTKHIRQLAATCTVPPALLILLRIALPRRSTPTFSGFNETTRVLFFSESNMLGRKTHFIHYKETNAKITDSCVNYAPFTRGDGLTSC